ncbi:fimbrial protein [Pseudomonas sp. NPDC089406]|uniref:fimbrial protein n=1 Tax=Pseudomonas sp. NPDC089406 TaxID=3364463 RepID=UPI00384B63C4
MKKSLFATSFGLVLSVAASSAFANTGTVHFQGTITAATCPIVIQPPSGLEGGIIDMGEVPASAFEKVSDEKNPRDFDLVVKDGVICGITPGQVAKVTFDGPSAANNYYAINRSPDAALGVAVALRDRNFDLVPPGSSSAEYPLNEQGESRLRFTASYVSITDQVRAGEALADLSFTVDIP